MLAASALAYLPSLDGEFVLDDFTVVGDPLVVAPLDHGLGAWLASPRPILAATFALNHATVGLDSRSWHIGNLLVHLAAVVLAWRLVRRLLERAGLERPDGPALVSAGLFSLHPLQTESVSYVAQRGESLASALSLAVLLILLGRDEVSSARRRWSLLGAGAALLATGLLVKPIGVTLPLVWLLTAAFLPPEAERADPVARPVIRRLPAAAPLLALAVWASLRGLSAAAGSGHAGLDMPGVSPWTYLATQLRVIPIYLGRVAWPAGQCADCFISWSDGLLDPAALAGGAFMAVLAGLGGWLAWRARNASGDGAAVRRLAGFAILFFLLLLVPTSSVVPLRDPLVEHRVYLALLGLVTFASAAATAALRAFVPARAPVVGTAVALAVLAAAGLATARRNTVWATALAFHQDAAAKAPQKARVHLNLGVALMRARRFEEAVASFRRARTLEADRTVSPRQVFDYLQAALLNAGQIDEARRSMLDTLMADPDDPWALANLAEVEQASGRLASAVEAARVALVHEPGNVKALKYLGLALAAQGDSAGAVVPLRAAAASSNEPGVHAALGLLEERLGDRAAACRALARSAQLATGFGMSPSAAPDLQRLGCR